MHCVLVLLKDGKRRDFTLDQRQTTIGRRPDCTLRIPTRDVSRQHCEIIVEPKRVHVRDLGSANGTYVNDKRVAEVDLKAGDKLRVGPALFIVQINGLPAKIESAKPDKPKPQKPQKPEKSAAPILTEDELFELNTDDLEFDDPIRALDDDDEKDMP